MASAALRVGYPDRFACKYQRGANSQISRHARLDGGHTSLQGGLPPRLRTTTVTLLCGSTASPEPTPLELLQTKVASMWTWIGHGDSTLCELVIRTNCNILRLITNAVLVRITGWLWNEFRCFIQGSSFLGIGGMMRCASASQSVPL
jgi:hypothetical protein